MGLWKPPKHLNLSEWAEEFFYLPPANTKFHAHPYQIGIMDAITDPRISKVTVMKSSQIGWSTIIAMVIGYFIHHDPCPIIVVQPNRVDAMEYSKDFITPLLRDTPCLNGVMFDGDKKKVGNTILHKQFPGGVLYVIGAETAREFRRKTSRVNISDELDAWKYTTEDGDQEELLEDRQRTYWNSLDLKGSTPTITDQSRIEASFKKSDQRYLYVPCPHCGNEQVLKFGGKDCDYGLKWKDKNKLEDTYYLCSEKHCKIEHEHKNQMVDKGRWVATSTSEGHAGFHIWAAYSYQPKASWPNIAAKWLGTNKNPDKLKVFFNTWCGETYTPIGVAIEKQPLMDRRENYVNAPEGVGLTIASVDVHGNRLEWMLLGYGPYSEIWFIEHRMLIGSPRLPEVWEKLKKLISGSWLHESGTIIKPSMTLIDHGFESVHVENFVRSMMGRNVFAIKGADDPKSGKKKKEFISEPSLAKLEKNIVHPLIMGTTAAYDHLYGLLSIEQPGPSYIHFNQSCMERHFAQLTAKKKVNIVEQGRVTGYEYVEKKKDARDEWLDLFCYNIAGFQVMKKTDLMMIELVEEFQKVGKFDKGKFEVKQPEKITINNDIIEAPCSTELDGSDDSSDGGFLGQTSTIINEPTHYGVIDEGRTEW